MWPEAWAALQNPLALARAELQAAAPDAPSAAEADAYLLRIASACLTEGTLAHLQLQDGLTRIIPTRGAPNPDYRMWQATLDPTQHYRLEGRLHDSERVGVGLYAVTAEGLAPRGYRALCAADLSADGSFSLDLAPHGSAPGLRLADDARVLLIRCLHRDPRGRPCSLALSSPRPLPRSLPAQIDPGRALAQAGQSVLRAVRQFIRWSEETGREPNRLAPPPPRIAHEVQGDPETQYYLGSYLLAADQWLEVLIPEGLGRYWSLYAYTHWLEALPDAGCHERIARHDEDGRIRLRIGPAVPQGLHNRIDTQGRARGVLIFRSLETTPVPVPATQIRPCEPDHGRKR